MTTAVMIVTAAGSLVFFAVVYAVVYAVTRPAGVPAAPPTPELGAEPPAVVSLLVNRWQPTADTSESTLLDLAARRVLELRQPADDPRQTTIHLTEGSRQQSGPLTPYEQRVLDRVRGLAVDGVVPLAALTFRDPRQARAWDRRLHEQVLADARHRGLCRPRFSVTVKGLLALAAAISATGMALAGAQLAALTGEDADLALWAGGVAFILLSGFLKSVGQSHTKAGREALARWSGVREWLRRHEEFANLPPAAVMVWDRYLAYGASLGVTRLASAVLDLGMGDRKRVWSSYGGSWRQVRVRYPRFWKRYGKTAPALISGALVSGAAGAGLAYADRSPQLGLELPTVVLAVGLLLMLRAGYRLIRVLADLATVRTITGEVLWVEPHGQTQHKGHLVPAPHYLAVDDGSDDRTTAWILPAESRPGPHHGDEVTVRVRPWSRRVVGLAVDQQGRAAALTEAELIPAPGTIGVDDKRLSPLAAYGAAIVLGNGHRATGFHFQPAVAPSTLLTADEVSQALGAPVQAEGDMSMGGLATTATFRTAGKRGRRVLMVHAGDGVTAQLAWPASRRGRPLPGIGDEAYHQRERAAARVGGVTVLLSLLGPGKAHAGQLPQLLRQAAAPTAPVVPRNVLIGGTNVELLSLPIVAGFGCLLLTLAPAWAAGTVYNKLVRQRNQVEASWAQIDVQLTRRHDLIPNLVETVKGYATHERTALEQVIRARSEAVSANQQGAAARAEAENVLTAALGRLFALSEAYPDLKANQNYAQLQAELAATENKIAYARQFYNSAVQTLTNTIGSVPSNLIAGIFRFHPPQYFEAAGHERGPVRVRF